MNIGLLNEGVVEEPIQEEIEGKETQSNEDTPEEAVRGEDIDNPKVDPTKDAHPVDASERPEWCPENFWDKKKLTVNAEALSKSYAELRSAFNKKNNDKIGHEVEDYILDAFFTDAGNFKAEGVAVPKDDPLLIAAYKAAKESGLGIKATNEFITKFLGESSEFALPPIDINAEIAKLGKNGIHIVSGIKTWIDGLETKGTIDSEVKDKMIELGSTAAGIKALDVLRRRSGEQGLPTNTAITGSQNMTANDWYAAKFETHAEHGENRNQYNARMREIGKKIFGEGVGTFNGSGFGIGGR